MKWIAIGALVVLCACKGAGDTALERYEFLRANGGSAGELCTASQAVADGFAQDKDAEKYREWSGIARNTCSRAALMR